ncbi:MAG: hypothetical protein IJ794_15425 [Lachnospiraceae bacterium]|nr:hypothetical protein [Lachnospiraceae bacterium]
MIFIRNDLLASELSQLYWNSGFAPYAPKREELELLLAHYYVRMWDIMWYDECHGMPLPKEEDRDEFWQADFDRRRTERVFWVDEFMEGIWYESKAEVDSNGQERLFDILQAKGGLKDRFWIGGRKEHITIYYYGRDYLEYDLIWQLEPKDEADSWNPEDLWKKSVEPASYRFYREEDRFIWEGKDERLIFEDPDLYRWQGGVIWQEHQIEHFTFDLRMERMERIWQKENKWCEVKEYLHLGIRDKNIVEFNSLLRTMLSMPCRIAGHRGIFDRRGERGFEWTERIIEKTYLEEESSFFEVTKREDAEGRESYDFLVGETSPDWEEPFRRGAVEAVGFYNLNSGDVEELLKCLEAFRAFAYQNYQEEERLTFWNSEVTYDGYRVLTFRHSGEIALPEKSVEEKILEKDHFWKIELENIYDCGEGLSHYLSWHPEYEEQWKEHVVCVLEAEGFLNTANGGFVNFDGEVRKCSEVDALLLKLFRDPWVRENIINVCIQELDSYDITDEKTDRYERYPEERGTL